jgi:cation:H+ antiporter
VLLVLAGRLVVSGATGIALSFGIEPFIIGATVVAFGTSAPEIATAVVAKLRGHDEVGLGTILGSNIFNCLFIVGIAATISPIRVQWREAVVALAFGFLALVAVYPRRDGSIDRARAPLLLLLYFLYVLTVI